MAELDLEEGKSEPGREHGRTMGQPLSASNQESYNDCQIGREWLVFSVSIRSSTRPCPELHAAILESFLLSGLVAHTCEHKGMQWRTMDFSHVRLFRIRRDQRGLLVSEMRLGRAPGRRLA